MAGKRSFTKLMFDGSGEEVIELNEGLSGRFSVWTKRTAGSATTAVTVSGSFVSSPASEDKAAVGTANATNSVAAIAQNQSAQFPYLVVSVVGTTATTSEVYIVSF